MLNTTNDEMEYDEIVALAALMISLDHSTTVCPAAMEISERGIARLDYNMLAMRMARELLRGRSYRAISDNPNSICACETLAQILGAKFSIIEKNQMGTRIEVHPGQMDEEGPTFPHGASTEFGEWLEVRKHAAKEINPDNAEVCWRYAYTLDPWHPGSPGRPTASWSRVLRACTGKKNLGFIS
jgi:hypothetical protein